MATPTLRPAAADDAEFLYRLYAGTRRAEFAAAAWDAARLEALLRLQFDARRRHLAQQFPSSRVDIVEIRGAAAGSLWIDEGDDAWRLLDIALLPEHRGRGVGTALLRDLMARAARRVGLHVEVGNPARRLYERLGFTAAELHGVHLSMHWQPAPDPAAHPPTHRMLETLR